MSRVHARRRVQVQLLKEDIPPSGRAQPLGSFYVGQLSCGGEDSKNELLRFHTLIPETYEYDELSLL